MNQAASVDPPEHPSEFARALASACSVFSSLAPIEQELRRAAKLCVGAIRSGGKILTCGNGGSACEALHLVGELAGRYKQDREPFGALALCTDPVLMTCIGNDFAFEDVFSRQVKALCSERDVLIAFSTSGQSVNIARALRAAREIGARTIAFLGRDGGSARELADCPLLIPAMDTARIQEAHQFLLHSLMDEIEAELT